MYIPCILLTDKCCLRSEETLQIQDNRYTIKFDNKSSQYKNPYHIQNSLKGLYYICLNTKLNKYILTTRSLLIKSQLIISAICGENSQNTKAGDSFEFYR